MFDKYLHIDYLQRLEKVRRYYETRCVLGKTSKSYYVMILNWLLNLGIDYLRSNRIRSQH